MVPGRGRWGSTVSAGELPLVSFSFVDVLEDFGFAEVFRLLVPESAAATSLLHLHAFAAVHVWWESGLRPIVCWRENRHHLPAA